MLTWFNKISVNAGPGAGNRCFEILRLMFNHAERWGLRPEGSNPCAYIRLNKRRKCERFLSNQEIARLGEVLSRKVHSHPLHASIIYLLLLTGCQSSEITGLTWSEVKGGRLLLNDSKTGPRTVWLRTMKNTVTLVGFVGNNPEVRSVQSGASITNLSLATTRSFKDGEGNRQTETEWHRITCFNGVGKCVAEHVTKGAMIMVTGRIHHARWTDNTGQTRYGCEIVAEQVDFLAKAKEATSNETKKQHAK